MITSQFRLASPQLVENRSDRDDPDDSDDDDLNSEGIPSAILTLLESSPATTETREPPGKKAKL